MSLSQHQSTPSTFLNRMRSSMSRIMRALSRLSFNKKNSSALAKLPDALYDWNAERISHAKQHQLSQSLNTDHLNHVKQAIQSAVSSTTAKLPETFNDQLFFLVMGAIQTQSQTGSTKPWQLIDQSIDVYTSTKSDKPLMTFGLLSVITLFSIGMMMQHAKQPSTSSSEPPSLFNTQVIERTSTADNVTINMLTTAYQKMKDGTCQLPQAAMLPAAQRLAFINFVNKGAIDVNNIENLRLAFSYVNCLYPQQLMQSDTVNSH